MQTWTESESNELLLSDVARCVHLAKLFPCSRRLTVVRTFLRESAQVGATTCVPCGMVGSGGNSAGMSAYKAEVSVDDCIRCPNGARVAFSSEACSQQKFIHPYYKNCFSLVLFFENVRTPSRARKSVNNPITPIRSCLSIKRFTKRLCLAVDWH